MDLAKKLSNPVSDLISLPIQGNLIVSKLQPIGGQPVQFFAGARYYLDKPDQGPEWGLRFGFTLLFPNG